MDKLKKKEQKQISELLFKYFIMNDKYIAVQMPDGKYIPKKVFCSPQLVYDMLMCGASMGTYQQKYCHLCGCDIVGNGNKNIIHIFSHLRYNDSAVLLTA